MFWNPEVITTTGKSLRITQIQFNIIYIMRTSVVVAELRCPYGYTGSKKKKTPYNLGKL